MRLARFKLTNMTTGRVWNLRTSKTGRAEFALPRGLYRVRPSGLGGWTFNVRAGQTVTRSFVAAVP